MQACTLDAHDISYGPMISRHQAVVVEGQIAG